MLAKRSGLNALVICIPSEPHTYTPVEQVMFADVQMKVTSCSRKSLLFEAHQSRHTRHHTPICMLYPPPSHHPSPHPPPLSYELIKTLHLLK